MSKSVFGSDGMAIQTCMHEPTMKEKSGIDVAGLSLGYASAFHHSDPLADQWQHDANQTHS